MAPWPLKFEWISEVEWPRSCSDFSKADSPGLRTRGGAGLGAPMRRKITRPTAFSFATPKATHRRLHAS